METIYNCNKSQEFKMVLVDIIKNPVNFLLMTGLHRKGKTFAAKIVYNIYNPHAYPAYDHDRAWFETQADLNTLWTKRQAEYGETYTLLEEIKSTKMLIIDDFGSRTPTEAFLDFLYAIIDHRYANKKGTIITTNLTSDQLGKSLSTRILRRISSGYVTQFTKDDVLILKKPNKEDDNDNVKNKCEFAQEALKSV